MSLITTLRHNAIGITQREDALLLAVHAGEIAQDAVFVDMKHLLDCSAGEPLCRSKDVNRDGLDDLARHIQANQLSQDTGKAIATLNARTQDGDILMGQDVIGLVPQPMGIGGFRALELHQSIGADGRSLVVRPIREEKRADPTVLTLNR